MPFDAITLGGATRDVFIRSESLDLHDSDHSPTGKEQCFPLGSKIEISDIVFATGGGGTNAAVTFARLGFRTAAIGAIGDDENGHDVLSALAEEGVSRTFVQTHRTLKTAFSIVAISGSGERTVMVYRGASGAISGKKIRWPAAHAKWMYIASLGGDTALLKSAVTHANKNRIKIAWNPGLKELETGIAGLEPVLRGVDVAIMNMEEAAKLTGLAPSAETEMLKLLAPMPKRALVITDGPKGAIVAAQEGSFRVDTLNVPPVNVTGAGDAFGSAFAAALMKKDDLRFAAAVATWNASGVIQKTGAKAGIIKKWPTPAMIAKVPIHPLTSL